MFKKTVLSVWVLSGIMLLFFYNNCGRMDGNDSVRTVNSSFVNAQNYPWPNQYTTEEKSSFMASKVSFGDVNQDNIVDAVFVSTDRLSQSYIIRVVQAESFKEILNIKNLPEPPDLATAMLIVDLQGVRGEKELVYVNQSRTRLVGVALNSASAQVYFNEPVVEPMRMDQEYDFKMTRLAEGHAVEVGNNLIPLTGNGTFNVESGLTPIDGQWGPWSGWYQFTHGGTCSKICGDGIEVRNRPCDSPAPRNGGLVCQPQTVDGQTGVGSVHARSCRVRNCLPTECSPFEIFVNGSCEPDPNNPDPNATGPSGRPGYVPSPGGGGSGTDDGYDEPGDCASDEAFDPFFYKCFKAYQRNDIRLTHYTYSYVSNDDGRGTTRVQVANTHRLVINTSKHRGIEDQTIADEYCRFQGYAAAISFIKDTYTAGDTVGFYLCSPGINGEYLDCPVSRNYVRFNYQSTFQMGATVEYLKSVTCRQDN